MLEIYLYKLETKYLEENREQLLTSLCQWRREKAEKIKNPKVQLVSIAAGLLIQKVFSERLSIDKDAISVVLGDQGKPMFLFPPDRNEKCEKEHSFHFNLSHSGDYIALAVSDANVGIDIECKEDKGLRVAKRCFTESEYAYIMAEKEELRMQAFRDIWTMKESFLKFTGTGISVPLHSFSIDMENHAAVTDSGEKVKFFLHRFGTDPEYSMAVCYAPAGQRFFKKQSLSLDIHEVLKL